MTDGEQGGPDDAILRVRGVRKSYRSGGGMLEVLRGVDFAIAPGGFVAVVGQSGSGKSTLLHLMGLLDAPDAGEVHLDGGRIDDLFLTQYEEVQGEPAPVELFRPAGKQQMVNAQPSAGNRAVDARAGVG